MVDILLPQLGTEPRGVNTLKYFDCHFRNRSHAGRGIGRLLRTAFALPDSAAKNIEPGFGKALQTKCLDSSSYLQSGFFRRYTLISGVDFSLVGSLKFKSTL